MLYGVYSIRDAKTGFMTPTIDSNDASATRNFFHAIVNSETVLRTYSADFDLYCLGHFDSDSGQLTPQTPVFVASGAAAFRAVSAVDQEVS